MNCRRAAVKTAVAVAIAVPLTAVAAPVATADTGSASGSASISSTGSAVVENLTCQISWNLYRLLNPTAPTPVTCPLP